LEKKMNKYLVILVTFTAALSMRANAQLAVGTTYNTGYSGGVALAPGAIDPNFTIVSAPVGEPTGINPFVPTSTPSAWYTSTTAQYISPSDDQHYPPDPANGGDLPGYYDYQAVLSTDFFAPTEVTFTGSYAADNTASVEIGGESVVTGLTPPVSQFGGPLVPFTLTLLVASGHQNTNIDFLVENYNSDNSSPQNSDGQDNPTGLLVSNLKATAATPEPSTYAMMLGGLALLGFCVRRKLA
jgi:hypothetical protein